jgi:hypothetical protein
VYCIPGYTVTDDPGSKLDQTYAQLDRYAKLHSEELNINLGL